MLPKHVSVLGVKFRVELVPASAAVSEDLCGDCDGPGHVIRIYAKHNKTLAAQESTLLHELLHAALYVSGHTAQLQDAQEEAIVLALENALSQLYKRA